MAEKITGYTELIGLIAYPIKHSTSPAMHNAAFDELGLDYVYLAFEVDDKELENAVQSIRTLKMRGVNVSMPNKTLVQKYIDEITPAASLCGAVNTIVNDNGKLTGYITDGIGFMRSLKDNEVDVIGKKITVVGSGGAATAIQIQAALDGVREISIFNRKDEFWENALNTVEKIRANTNCKVNLYELSDLDRLKMEIDDSVLLVNATNIGMGNLVGKTYIPSKDFLRKDLVVVDVIYHPSETELLKMAKEVGCKAFNGLGMVLFQGAEAFKLWTGKEMPIDHVKKILGLE